MNVILKEEAIADIFEIHRYYFDKNPLAATKIINRIDRALLNLSYFPNIGILVKDQFRSFTVPNTKYLLIYKLEEDNIIVSRVWHGNQLKPEQWV